MLFIIIPAFFIAIILLNFLIIRAKINQALRKYIKPHLAEKGLTYVNYKWLGFFNSGDFNDLSLTFASNNGSASPSIYIDVLYQSVKEQKRVTARVETVFVSISGVKYSREL